MIEFVNIIDSCSSISMLAGTTAISSSSYCLMLSDIKACNLEFKCLRSFPCLGVAGIITLEERGRFRGDRGASGDSLSFIEERSFSYYYIPEDLLDGLRLKL
jgi:hypothetical protein